MKMSRSLLRVSRMAAMGIVLLSLMAGAIPCDEGCCSDEAEPSCDCLCVCYSLTMAVPASDPLPAADVVQDALDFESAQVSTLLVADIFRPPIA